MAALFPHVMAPIRVAGHLLKNRIISAPSTIHTASNGEPYPTELGIRFFEDRAKAGAGLVTCAGVSIGGANNDGVHASWDIYVPNHTNRLCDLAERIHLYGAKCTMELIGVFPDGYTVCDGCSIMGSPPIGRQIPVEEMMKFKQGYVDAAIAIKNCGFDGILLHFGHSIPMAQFLSPYTNKRTDEYGGSTENRCRYPREVLKAVREAVGREMIIEVRMSATEYQEGGIDQAEGLRIAEQLQEYCDIIQASAGMHNTDWMTWTHPCGFLPPMPNVFLAEGFKKSGKITKLVSTIGGIGSLQDADHIIAEGKADFVLMSRSFIADLDIIHKGLEDRQEDVIPCVKCMRCHDSDNYAQHMQCTVNPRVGLEDAIDAMPAPSRKKKVAVVGGGPAGMKAALTAAERGHEVTLFESGKFLGGALKFADYVSFKYPLKDYKDFLIRQIEKSPVTVQFNHTVTDAELKNSEYDAVIAAVGAEPIIPPIPGIETAQVATDAYGKEDTLGNTVVVIGGGQVGCETAMHLARLGKQVTILEMQCALAPDASKTHRDELMVEIEHEKNLTILCGARCCAVTDGEIIYEKDGVRGSLAADSVVLAAGMRAKTQQADSLMGITPEFFEIGDCVRARTVEWATKEAFYAAMNL
ncbi:MAG: FAD-dependent oxidoreductase [Oscillospiraceae bacterium]|nr:FAD-dependent oxidoreductase [Oscillospiraceae bacterium]